MIFFYKILYKKLYSTVKHSKFDQSAKPSKLQHNKMHAINNQKIKIKYFI